MLELVLATADMTTEAIADGRHLAPDLLKFTLQMKGPDKTALVTDSSRAMDMPRGDYTFGPQDGGEAFHHDGEVGLTMDGNGLASGAKGMDHMFRHMHQQIGIDLPTAVRMATLTPATILGLADDVGSLVIGKRADLVLLDSELHVAKVFVDGQQLRREH